MDDDHARAVVSVRVATDADVHGDIDHGNRPGDKAGEDARGHVGFDRESETSQPRGRGGSNETDLRFYTNAEFGHPWVRRSEEET